MEVWKDICGYEGLYQVSNSGNVRRIAQKVKPLKPSIKNGYYFVVLSKGNKKENRYIHRLVADAFVKHSENLSFVNHKDENKLNNSTSNLEWCTQKYNNDYGTRRKREIETKSVPVRQLLNGVCVKVWASTQEAQRSGYRSGCISLCCSGKRKTHAGYEWRWAT